MKFCKKLIAAVSVLWGLSGCATGYQPFNSFSGGYGETQLDTNVYTVTFTGNGATSMAHAEDMALLRAADLMRSAGYPFFALLSEKERASTSSSTMPSYATTRGTLSTYSGGANYRGSTTISGGDVLIVSRPTKSITIFGFKERPNIAGTVYDAQLVFESIKRKYSLK